MHRRVFCDRPTPALILWSAHTDRTAAAGHMLPLKSELEETVSTVPLQLLVLNQFSKCD